MWSGTSNLNGWERKKPSPYVSVIEMCIQRAVACRATGPMLQAGSSTIMLAEGRILCCTFSMFHWIQGRVEPEVDYVEKCWENHCKVMEHSTSGCEWATWHKEEKEMGGLTGWAVLTSRHIELWATRVSIATLFIWRVQREVVHPGGRSLVSAIISHK